MIEKLEAEALMKFPAFLRKHHIPTRTGYNWKEWGVVPVIQVGRVIMIRESEALAALERFKRHAATPKASKTKRELAASK